MSSNATSDKPFLRRLHENWVAPVIGLVSIIGLIISFFIWFFGWWPTITQVTLKIWGCLWGIVVPLPSIIIGIIIILGIYWLIRSIKKQIHRSPPPPLPPPWINFTSGSLYGIFWKWQISENKKAVAITPFCQKCYHQYKIEPRTQRGSRFHCINCNNNYLIINHEDLFLLLRQKIEMALEKEPIDFPNEITMNKLIKQEYSS